MVAESAASLGSKAIHTFAARVLATALAIATGILIARTLGPAGKGTYTAVAALLSIPLALVGGGGAAITYLLTKQRRTIRELLPMLGIVFACVTAAIWTALAVYSWFRGWNTVTVFMAVATPASVVLAWQPSFYIATGELRRFNVQTVALSAAVLCGAAAVLFGTRLQVRGVLAVWTACTYVLATVVIWNAFHGAGNFQRQHTLERLREFGRFGVWSASNTALGLINYRVDSFILAALLGLVPFGIYSIAVSAGEAILMLSRPVTSAVTRQIGIETAQRAAEITARTVRISGAMTAAAAAILYVAGPALISVFYGARFAPAADALRWLLPGIVAFSSAGTFASFFLFQIGRPAIVTATNLAMIGVQFGACMLLVPRYGLTGAAMASTATYGLGAAFNTVLFCRLTGRGPARVWIVREADVALALEVLRHTFRRAAPGTA